ncbi:TetR/AcrR family transcriptional regulator [Rhizobium sp. 1399]|jgi:AcrR family transcriptional regulator|uniref:TetR/AcrR family transcriptional regulator n=1 Tax=Rhizobium sp. 1399 TaxID=2817758 RepID=UPI002863F2C4|nr:TetR/AcrR family transcriptional regulator [Rhizobium sp. 1399]MDR6670021.1 AcrR family transcriptional regulator [Rhizobium sp. 1399]
MARPLSEDKRTALLNAAVAAIATLGTAASTAKVAKDAGLGEGTLFVYFQTKDELLNQVFLTLKADLRDAITSDYPATASVKDRFAHIWDRRINWGATSPIKQKALRQLAVSEKLQPARETATDADCRNIETIFAEGFQSKVLRPQPVEFLVATIDNLAAMVLDMAEGSPDRLAEYKDLGWSSLWSSISR